MTYELDREELRRFLNRAFEVNPRSRAMVMGGLTSMTRQLTGKQDWSEAVYEQALTGVPIIVRIEAGYQPQIERAEAWTYDAKTNTWSKSNDT